MESELANCIVVYILRHKLLSRRLCLSQARMKEEGSAVGLQPTQVKHIEQQKQRKIQKTGQERLEDNIRGRRLRWMGHVAHMDGERRAIQAMKWTPEGKRGRGRPRKNWAETIREDLRPMELSWNEAIGLAEDREEWRKCVARFADLHRMD